MASLDFVYDLSSKLDKDGFNYALFILKKGKVRHKTTIYYKLDNKKSAKLLHKSIDAFQNSLNNV